jgi:hypothetical protein
VISLEAKGCIEILALMLLPILVFWKVPERSELESYAYKITLKKNICCFLKDSIYVANQ